MRKLWILVGLLLIPSVVMAQTGEIKIGGGPSEVMTPWGLLLSMPTFPPGRGTYFELWLRATSTIEIEPQFGVLILKDDPSTVENEGACAYWSQGTGTGNIPIDPVTHQVDISSMTPHKDPNITITWVDIGPDGVIDTSDDVAPAPPSTTQPGENWYLCLGTEGYPCYTPICQGCSYDNCKMNVRIDAKDLTPLGGRAVVFVARDTRAQVDVDAKCRDISIDVGGADLVITWLQIILVPASMVSFLGLAKYFKWF